MFPLNKTLSSIHTSRLYGLMCFVAFLGLFQILLAMFGITYINQLWSPLDKSWMNTMISVILGVVTGIGAWFILPVLVAANSGIFIEYIISKVERKEYPEFIRKSAPRFWPDIFHDIHFLVLGVSLNVMLIPFYFLGGFGIICSVILNSYLLGREFFEASVGYYHGKKEARRIGKLNLKIRNISGLVATLIALIPVANLFVPIVMVIWNLHLYHELIRDTQKLSD